MEWERRTTGSAGNQEGVMSATLSASRPFSSRLSGTFAVDFSFRDFGAEDQRKNRVASVSGGLGYVLTRNTNLAIDLSRS